MISLTSIGSEYMKDKYEFITTKWQYLFNSSVKNAEISFITAIAAVVVTIIRTFSQNENLEALKTINTSLFIVLSFSVFLFIYHWVKINASKATLPTLTIDENGIILNELSEIREIKRNEITDVSVKGYFNKKIHLTKNKRSSIYVLDYYLFEPEQRVKILALLNSMAGR